MLPIQFLYKKVKIWQILRVLYSETELIFIKYSMPNYDGINIESYRKQKTNREVIVQRTASLASKARSFYTADCFLTDREKSLLRSVVARGLTVRFPACTVCVHEFILRNTPLIVFTISCNAIYLQILVQNLDTIRPPLRQIEPLT